MSSSVTRLSIAIPTYNFGAFLPATLRSLLPQAEARGVEIVVVDGASTDDTAAVVDGFRSSCLRYVRLPRRGGIDADMDTAVRTTRTAWCWLFSADDIARPGAIDHVLGAIDDGVDVIVGRHSDCTLDMRVLALRPMFSAPANRTANLGDVNERRRWFRDAVSTEACFSFMSALVVNTATWSAAPNVDAYRGTCWQHVARFFALAAGPGLRAKAVDDVWLDRRGDNDSFLNNGVVARLALAIDGLTRIVSDFFGAGSDEVAELRRALRWELPLPTMLRAKHGTWAHPERENGAELERLFEALSIGATGRQAQRLRFVRALPAAACFAAAAAYDVVGRLRA